MTFRSRPLLVAAGALSASLLIGTALVERVEAQQSGLAVPAKGKSAGEVFHNVTTASLKGLTVDDFLSAMGVISADLGLDCADCHPGAGSDKVDWVIDPPRKKMARRMIDMLAAINKTNFGGVQEVTCFTCHHGKLRPTTTIQLDKLYGPPNDEQDDIVTPVADGPNANQIIDKYITALGGAQKLAALKSWVATGTSLGYGGLGGGGSFHIYAEAPDRRTVDIQFKEHPERGDSTWKFNGKAGWVKSPRGLLSSYDLTGGELNGQHLDALLAFPGQIKTALTNFRVGVGDDIGDHSVDVVQGRSANGELATLSFDRKTGLLVRMVRYGQSPVGRVPVQYDYDDYREVNGIKFPFKYTFSWLDGRQAFQIDQVEVNIPIEAAVFNKP
jgi:photosynthetic reaction center cytochrome c subunit